ncbi:MAG: hypothetical protein KDI36_11610 [Pseudomonadales bacterium]|nr:hypothetical protein [Pseudomonadales bacterium]
MASFPKRSLIPVLCALLTLGSCASVTSSITAGLADDLAASIMNSNDIDTVREGIPAYLIMIDSFLRGSPDDENLLVAASTLNGAFSNFTDGDRARLLTEKSLHLAAQAICVYDDDYCGLQSMAFEDFQQVVDGIDSDAMFVAYPLGVAWTGWIQTHSDDWNAVAQLSRVKYLMNHLIVVDEYWEMGGPHLYMGGLETVLPASMGGRPELGREHFERAIEIARGDYLMTKVVYAEQYAKLTFDKALYDRLLTEVISADPEVEGMTLTNTLAQRRARELLAESDDYF